MTYILYVYTKTDKTNQGLGKLSKNKLWFKGLDSDYKLFFEHPLEPSTCYSLFDIKPTILPNIFNCYFKF